MHTVVCFLYYKMPPSHTFWLNVLKAKQLKKLENYQENTYIILCFFLNNKVLSKDVFVSNVSHWRKRNQSAN